MFSRLKHLKKLAIVNIPRKKGSMITALEQRRDVNMKKPTSFNISETLKYVENEILKESGLSQVAFHRKAIDYFIEGDHTIDEDLRITKRTDPRYIKKPVLERIYLEEEQRIILEQIRIEQNTNLTTLLFQALYDYCVVNCKILSDEILQNIMYNNFE